VGELHRLVLLWDDERLIPREGNDQCAEQQDGTDLYRLPPVVPVHRLDLPAHPAKTCVSDFPA
jgi:hypothetical protein